MSRDILLQADGLGKAYPRRENAVAYMLGLLFATATTRGAWALSDVSLTLARGEALGVVGRNGAGKSTLLQILCGTQTPTTGSVACTARIAAMLELGAGFNPEFTGRENVVLNASVYGLTDRQIAERYPAIAAFADIGEFIDRPVEEYSSGMRARLAFAICAHVDADILVVDEVLGVGDAAFQAKCAAFIERFLANGAVVFVSHDDNAVLSVCTRAIWLDKGRMKASGSAEQVLRQYRAAMAIGDRHTEAAGDGEDDEPAPAIDDIEDARPATNAIAVSRFIAGAPSHGHGGAVIDDVYFSDATGTRLDTLIGGSPVILNIRGRAEADITRPILGFILRDAVGQNLFGDNSWEACRGQLRHLSPGDPFHAMLAFRMPLLPVGSYFVAPSIIDGTQQSHVQLFWMEEALVLGVASSVIRTGMVGVPMQADSRILPSGAAPSG